MREPGIWKLNGKGTLHNVKLLFPQVEWRAVEDGKERIIPVTAAHIKHSVCGNPLLCAMSIAIRSTEPDVTYTLVSKRMTLICYPRTGKVVRYVNSNKVVEAIIRLDETNTFEPGRYTLLAPPASSKLGASHSHTGKRDPRAPGDKTKMIRGFSEFISAASELKRKVLKKTRKKT